MLVGGLSESLTPGLERSRGRCARHCSPVRAELVVLPSQQRAGHHWSLPAGTPCHSRVWQLSVVPLCSSPSLIVRTETISVTVVSWGAARKSGSPMSGALQCLAGWLSYGPGVGFRCYCPSIATDSLSARRGLRGGLEVWPDCGESLKGGANLGEFCGLRLDAKGSRG